MNSVHQLSAISLLLARLRGPGDFVQGAKDNLPAPSIPSAEPNGGLRYYDLVDPTVHVLVLVRAYPQMSLNDHLVVYWNDEPVATDYIRQDHIEGASILIPVSSLGIEDGLAQVRYEVTSALGGNLYPSDALSIRVKTNVPGGLDTDDATPGINDRLTPVQGVPETTQDGDLDSLVATVPAYLNMTGPDDGQGIEADQITLSWNGVKFKHAIEPEDVGKDVCFDIPREVVEQAGSGDILIRYEIRDTVNNWSRWSQGFNTYAEIGGDLLTAPIAREVVEGVLDLDMLGDENAHVLVRAYIGMLPGDTVRLLWSAEAESERPLEYQSDFFIDDDNYGLPIVFMVPNAIAKASAGAEATLKYTVNPGPDERLSKRLVFHVAGQAQRLEPPRIQEAEGDRLELEAIPPSGATATVAAYPGMVAGDRLELFVVGDDGSSHYAFTDIDSTQLGNPVDFTVPKDFFERLPGQCITVHYRVNNEPSESLALAVVSQGAADLIAPEVDNAGGGVLDPDAVNPNGTKAWVLNYEGKAVGDSITLEWIGVYRFEAHTEVTEASQNTRIDFDIPYDPFIIGNLDTEVRVQYRVRRASGGLASSKALPIRVQHESGEELVAPTVLEASDGTLDPMAALTGATVRVRYTSMLPTDILAAAWVGETLAATWQSDQAPGSIVGFVDFTVPQSVVAASQGEDIQVAYGLMRNGKPSPSMPLELAVGELDERDLPTPVVPQAKGDTLDLLDFTGDAHMQVEPWPLIAQGQRFWCRIDGTLENGQAYAFYSARDQEVSAEQVRQGLQSPVARTELEKLKGDAELTLTLSVAFDKGRIEASAVAFPQRTYRLVKLPEVAPTLASVADDKGNPVPDGGSTTATTLLLTGKAAVNQRVQILDGAAIKDIVTAGANGDWTSTLTGLSVAAHSFKAKALYGSEPVSPAWAVTVVAATAPTITTVEDDKGTAVPTGSSTTATTLVLTGKAAVNQRVQILDGTAIKDTVTAGANGDWTSTLTGLNVAAHSFKAKGLYGGEPLSPAWAVTVIAATAPTIATVEDDKGTAVPTGSSTTATTLVLTGKAAVNQRVQILDGAAIKDTVTADAYGDWTSTLTGLSVAAHSFKAKALYGNEPVSPAWAVTVVAATAPTIATVKDDKSTAVPNGSATTATTLVLTGKAAVNQRVQILDGAAIKDTVTAGASGDWTSTLTGLSVAAHSFKAKGLYGGEPLSPAWGVTVVETVTPTIASVKDDRNIEIPDNGNTRAESITLSGRASKGLRIELLDGSVSKGLYNVNYAGVWTTQPAIAIDVGSHSFKAVAQYGNGQTSDIRRLERRQPGRYAYEDFESFAVGHQFPPYTTTTLPSGIILPTGAVRPVQIVAGNGGRELSFVLRRVDWPLLYFYIPWTGALMRPLRVTIEYQIISVQAKCRLMFSGKNNHDTIYLSPGAGTVTLDLPAYTSPVLDPPNTFTIGFGHRQPVLEDITVRQSEDITVRLRSVGWEEV
ncbi:hypothetical protein IAE37_003330 [Pseudomonas sp. S31]|uniref:hypothetical protein n=1 Tax=Pseudomonas sp. S31 TaxID=1564473 RepID=UPI001913CB25|nr:hypothetical protein [Pseudomonas sp. S31]MBK5001054.1 hypothetical protein [Pseudomonas sp. S31]